MVDIKFEWLTKQQTFGGLRTESLARIMLIFAHSSAMRNSARTYKVIERLIQYYHAVHVMERTPYAVTQDLFLEIGCFDHGKINTSGSEQASKARQQPAKDHDRISRPATGLRPLLESWKA
jgi:hypothetical protein